ncbi:MAG: PEP-CTERM sorting domain-containing protein [Bryobacteraceae bacterium]
MMLKTLGIALILAASSSSVVKATLLGETVRLTHELPNVGAIFGGPIDVVVGPGVEAPLFIGIYSVDLDDTDVLVTFPNSCCGGFGNTAFNGLHMFDVNGTIGDILSVTINPATLLAGFNASRITFDANNIYVNFAGLNPNPSTDLVALDITAAPEPSTWLFMAGLAVFVAMRRTAARRRI